MILGFPAPPPASQVDPHLWSAAQAPVDQDEQVADPVAEAGSDPWPRWWTARVDAVSCGLDVRGSSRWG